MKKLLMSKLSKNENFKSSSVKQKQHRINSKSFKTLKNHFIIHPFGTQQFPDILIFCNDYVFCLEIKSISNLNKSSLPVWNSNLPKASSFYVYIQTNNNITFFKGEDFLGNSTRSYLNSFFDLIDEKQMLNDLKKKLSQHHLLSQSSENIFGLVPKIRKSFNYSLSFATNRNIGIFDNNLNKNWEDKLITFLRTFNE
ncbi:Uncharacterised protein [Mycoplasmopsis citelli]|uniref:Uncharacterized protein n=2 Tax=Mycoplasmopsis citelli TaxID=171281 RepID=A0A449B0Q8_9BACT|nr:Uncharacterised protein [Mycoplasmopsis citelli]